MYFGLNDACAGHRVEILNHLAPGKRLQYFCRTNNAPIDPTIRYLNFNEGKNFTFKDSYSNFGRTTWNCDLKHGPNMEYSFDIQVYRAASRERCGQFRQWTAKLDGIYFSRKEKVPGVLALAWNKKN